MYVWGTRSTQAGGFPAEHRASGHEIAPEPSGCEQGVVEGEIEGAISCWWWDDRQGSKNSS